jgi:acyl-CoA synthetase (AMP-forming)/AMP-acid ligase II/acyl carrier protein
MESSEQPMNSKSSHEYLFRPQEGWSYIDIQFDGDLRQERKSDGQNFWQPITTIAAEIEAKVPANEPVLLFYPNGIDFLQAFLACLISRRPAVPCNIPRKRGYGNRLVSILRKTGASYYLTTTVQYRLSRFTIEQNALPLEITAIITDEVPKKAKRLEGVPYFPDDIAFIQFTSGSTKEPRGAVIAQKNLTACLKSMSERWRVNQESVFGTWLPQFHDLGLIFGLLLPLYTGGKVVTLRPSAFMQQPRRWLEILSQYECTHTAAPSFAYQHCVDNIDPSTLNGISLSKLQMAMNAAEPISSHTMRLFNQRFACCGFEDQMFTPAYGLAESTLAITGSAIGAEPIRLALHGGQLLEDRVIQAKEQDPNTRILVSSGSVLRGVEIAIIQDDTKKILAEREIGEVWVRGDCVAQGYYCDLESSGDTFVSDRFAKERTSQATWLRTGDLGFLNDGELYITGREKDLIIINGRNYYPQDIEWVAQSQKPSIRNNSGAAFSVIEIEDEREVVVLVQEIDRGTEEAEYADLCQLIHKAVLNGLELSLKEIVLIRVATVPRTSSGKIQRSLAKKQWQDGKLEILYKHQFGANTNTNPSVEPFDLRSAPEKWITSWLAAYQGMVGTEAELAELERVGRIDLDSLGSTELVHDLQQNLKSSLPDTLIWDYPTIRRLAGFIKECS